MELDFLQVKATPQHKQTVQNFIFALYKGTIDEFWDMLADVDQMALYTEYEYIRSSNMNDYDGFRDFLDTTREEQRSNYASVQKQSGVGEMARYTPEGEVYIYLIENIQKKIHYIAPTEVKVVPVVLTLNMKYDAESTVYSAHWKVRIIKNDYKTALNL
ncbi:hypothetical protein [Paenibacillus sp. Soil750]|uniref:hypothetical protein n=1 Tax=Paenibacillus sp. Soil750 TaxID=1736398 RepID=UPI0006FC7B2D|nr:hypothetical protein [Paenibacillus sp. Soil750]KRE70771.1 hypothetical protein ASL11_10780 [Paenibacillus sp. Soil750]